MHINDKRKKDGCVFPQWTIAWIFMALCMLASLNVSSQPLDFRHYEVEDGLSNNIVICALQDQNGFMWFGTADGLNRFDGNTFRIFRHEDDKPYSIGSNAIRYLFKDHKDRLWIGTGKGLFYYDQKNERFLCVKATVGKYIRSIHDDAAGRLWFVASGGLHRFSLTSIDNALASSSREPSKTNTSFYLQPDIESISLPGTENQDFTAITSTADGSIWLGTQEGVVWQYTPEDNSFHHFFSGVLAGSSVEKLMEPTAGKLWIGSSKAGLVELNTHSGQFTGPLLLNAQGRSEIFVRDIMLYDKNEYWIATEEGLYKYKTSEFNNGRAQRQQPIQKVPGDPYSLSDNSLYALCKDEEGGIWLGSYFGGINYLPKRLINFEKYYPGTRTPGFAGNVIREIIKDARGDFWIGTEDAGVNQVNFKTGSFQNYQPSIPGQKLHTNIHGLYTEGSRLYIGTFEQGMEVMDLNTHEIIRQYKAGPGRFDLKSNYVNAISKTKAGQYYVCTARGLYRYFPKEDRFDLIKELPLEEFYSAISEDQEGRVWIGTHNHGVYYLENGKWRQLHIQLKGNDLLKSVRILYIKDDLAGRLWIATEDGLYRVSPAGKVKIFNDSNGLPGNIVYALVPDTLNDMWLTTSMGLARINHRTDLVKTFNQADGLLNNQFNNQSAYQDQDGFIYFGSVKGLIRFNPYSWKESDYCPSLFFTGLQVFNQEMRVDSLNSPLKQSMLMTDHLELNYKQSTFSLDFASLSYHSPSNLEFAYRVEGLDPEWTYVKGNRRIYFTNLKAGDYRLKIKSTNSSGVWVENERVLSIRILPPFWKSDTAYITYWIVLALLVGGGLYYNGRRHRIQAQRRMEIFKLNKEKELYQSKVDFFTHIAHEIRTPLTLIKGPMDKILSEKDHLPHLEGYIDLMQRNTNRLLDLTHELLDFRKIETNMTVLHLKEEEMGAWLIKQLASYQLAAETKGIHFLYIPPMQPISAKIDEKAVAKMVHNLLNNALKYAEAVIMIRLYSLSGQTSFTIQIENDGYLVPEELHQKIFDPFFRWNKKRQVKGSGIGLSVADTLAKLHGGTLTFSVSEEKYNTFKLILPLDAYHKSANKQT